MKVNFERKYIELTKKEMKRASQIDSEEYHNLIRVMRDLPDFIVTVSQATPSVNANRGLTYKCMEQYISQFAPEKMDEFSNIRSRLCYAAVNKWFRKTFGVIDIETISRDPQDIVA